MTKARAHAKWNGLSAKQRQTLEEWLHEDRLSYNEALERAQKELGFTGSRSSLRRFFERTRDERLLRGLTEAGKLAASVDGADVSVDELRNAGLKLAAQILLKQVAESPQGLKEWLPLVKLLVQAERNATWERVKDEENGIRQATLEFARTRFQFEAMEEAKRALPELKKWEEAQKDPKVKTFERNRLMNEVRRRVFGEPLSGILPENEHEEAHPEIIEKHFREARQQQPKQIHQERQREPAEAKKKEAPAAAKTVTPAERADGPGEPEAAGEREETGEARGEFVDEPKKLTAEERQRVLGRIVPVYAAFKVQGPKARG